MVPVASYVNAQLMLTKTLFKSIMNRLVPRWDISPETLYRKARALAGRCSYAECHPPNHFCRQEFADWQASPLQDAGVLQSNNWCFCCHPSTHQLFSISTQTTTSPTILPAVSVDTTSAAIVAPRQRRLQPELEYLQS